MKEGVANLVSNAERATPWNSRIASAVALCALLMMVLAQFHGTSRHDRIDRVLATSDFGAFYCAAYVLRTHGDPYKLTPLAACESHSVFEPGDVTLQSQGIDPAPLPPYALAAFVPFTYLPYREAGLAWLGLLLGALCASAAALRRLSGLPFAVTLAALAYGDGAICLAYGQEQPLVTLGLTVAAIALLLKRDGLAVLFSAVAFLEPQVGLPAMFALAVFSRARLAAVGTMAGLAALSLAVGGWHLNLEYVTRVLPVHAFSELGISIQYSLAAILFAARVPDALALHLAALQYALIAGIGVFMARAIADRIGRPALILFPAACAVVGGTFMHIQEIASALPFALYVFGRVPRFRAPAAVALVLLALPWPMLTSRSALVFEEIIIIGLAWLVFPAATLFQKSALAIAMVAICLSMSQVMTSTPSVATRQPEPPAAVIEAHFDPTLASTELAKEWRSVRASDGATTQQLAFRAPTWFALTLLVILGFRLAIFETPTRETERVRPRRRLSRSLEGAMKS